MNQNGLDPGLSPKKGSPRAILAAALIVLVLFAIYSAWRWRNYSKPRCAGYHGLPAAACTQLAMACGSNGECLNAVAHCMPILDRAAKMRQSAAGSAQGSLLNFAEQAELNACTHAIARIDPRFAANLLSGHGAPCMPAKYAAPFEDKAEYRAMVDVARAVEPLLPWAVQVAGRMPVCASPLTPPYAPVAPPYAPVAPPYAPVAPPYAPVTPPYAPVTPPYAHLRS